MSISDLRGKSFFLEKVKSNHWKVMTWLTAQTSVLTGFEKLVKK